MSDSNSLEDLRKQYPNYKTHQDNQPVDERARVQAQNARISWMKEHKPAHSGDWFNFRRRGILLKGSDE